MCDTTRTRRPYGRGLSQYEFTHYCVLMPETWWEYVERIAGVVDQKVIAQAAGVTGGQVSRWKKGDKPGAEPVIHFARCYNRPPTEALIAARFLSEDEASGTAILDLSVRDMSPDALALEIGSLVTELRRRIPGDQGEDWGEGARDGWVGNPPTLQQHPTMRRRQG